MSKRRVVCTGMGMVTPRGVGTEFLWKSTLAGESGLSRITHFDASNHDVQIAGYNHDFNGEKLLGPRMTEKQKSMPARMHRSTQMAMVAAYEAMDQSGLEVDEDLSDRFGCYIGTGGGGTEKYMEAADILASRGPRGVPGTFSFLLMPNHTVGVGAMLFGCGGPCLNVASACCTGLDAMRLAYQEIALDRCDAMLTGGTEATVNPAVIAAFGRAGAITRDFNDNPTAGSRPFSSKRSGFVWGEGAVVYVFEELEHAQFRGAKILFEILAAYATDDHFHETAPDPEGLGAKKAMRGALKQAGIDASDIDLVSLHGTSTPLNDKTETLAIKEVGLGETPAFASKSRDGHLIAASGPQSIAECYLGLRDKVSPPTLNYDGLDPECDLNLSAKARELPEDVMIGVNNNAGFGGHNTCIIIRLWKDEVAG